VFVGREQELQSLRMLMSKQVPAIAVIYGRRRIGKSALIRTAVSGQRVYLFEGLENQRKQKQLDNFAFQLAEQYRGDAKHPRARSWTEALMFLTPALRKEPGCVVLDEFQWMAHYRTEIVAELKMVWDQYWSQIQGVTLILCGSIASFMTTKVVKSSALYGRVDLEIHLKEFRLHETSKMLPGRGLDEIMDAQMLLGGVPKYLELIRDAPSVQLGIEAIAFTPNGYLTREYERIFISHFGKNPAHQRIIGTLAKHPYGLFRKQLAEKVSLAPGGSLSEYLFNLESAGFISSVSPIDKAENSRLIKYYLTDAYLRLYFGFILPNMPRLGTKGLFGRLTQTGAYQVWRDRAFEFVAIAHAAEIAELLGFSEIDHTCGPFFRAPRGKGGSGIQVDLLFSRADKVLTLCEMKCSLAPIGNAIIPEVEKKVARLQTAFPTKTIQRVLVVHGPVSETLISRGYFYRVIRAEDLFSLSLEPTPAFPVGTSHPRRDNRSPPPPAHRSRE